MSICARKKQVHHLRSDTMVTEELLLIQHLLQDTLKPVLASQSQQTPITLTGTWSCLATLVNALSLSGRVWRTFHVCHIPLRDLRPVLSEPLHTPLESRELVNNGWFQGKRRVERDKTDETTDGHLHTVARSELNGIVVETVMLVPKGDILIVGALVGHGVGDEDEVLQNS